MTNELAIRILTGSVLGTAEQTQEAVTMAVKALSVPSAQPEIIHCEECKYCRRENVTYVYADGIEQEVLDRYINCTKERYQPEVRLDDFCSRAERREDAVRKSDC